MFVASPDRPERYPTKAKRWHEHRLVTPRSGPTARTCRRDVETDNDNRQRGKRYRELVRSKEFPDHQVLMGLAGRDIRLAGTLAAGDIASQGQSGHTAPQ